MLIVSEIKRNILIGCFLGILLTSTLFVYVKLHSSPKDEIKVYDEFKIYHIQESQITSFGTYTPLTVNLSLKGPDIRYETDLSDVWGIDRITDERVKQMLSLQGFAVVESDYDQFYWIYKENQRNGYLNFITTDALLHTFHILYDYSLRYIETNTLYVTLVDLSEDLLEWSLNHYEQISHTNLKNAFGRLVAFFAVGLSFLDVEKSIPSELQDLVVNEVAKIENHSEITTSEITGNLVDFTQFIVRGHYTRSEILSDFFLSLMYYSRIGFFLQPDNESENSRGIDQTRLASLLTLGIFSDKNGKILNNWNLIYDPITFYVGKADDLTILDYVNLLDGYSLSELEQDSTIKIIIDKANNLPSPLILGTVSDDPNNWNSQTKGLRLMGQRFVPDSYFFQNLVFPEVMVRAMPSGLDIMAVLNSSQALYHQQDDINQYPDYLPKIFELQEDVKHWNDTAWTQNLYYLWLYSILPLLNGKGDQYPSFMRSTAWADKELNTALGSWAELRHDTILYAKHSYGPPPSMPPPPPDFAGSVEANPELYGRLLSLIRMLQDGLQSRNLITEGVMDTKLSVMEEILEDLLTIAEKEVRGENLSKDEHDIIFDLKDQLEYLIKFPSEIEDEYGIPQTDADDSVAIIADVHTDLDSLSVLEVGVGKVYEIFVIITDNDGNAYLSRGGVFSYYEFSQPMSKRLTDETWQILLESDNSPLTPTWTQSFVISKDD